MPYNMTLSLKNKTTIVLLIVPPSEFILKSSTKSLAYGIRINLIVTDTENNLFSGMKSVT